MGVGVKGETSPPSVTAAEKALPHAKSVTRAPSMLQRFDGQIDGQMYLEKVRRASVGARSGNQPPPSEEILHLAKVFSANKILSTNSLLPLNDSFVL